jgi:type VI protein secretion system component VasF
MSSRRKSQPKPKPKQAAKTLPPTLRDVATAADIVRAALESIPTERSSQLRSILDSWLKDFEAELQAANYRRLP